MKKHPFTRYLRALAWIMIGMGMYVILGILIDPMDTTVLSYPVYALYRLLHVDPVLYWRGHILVICLLFLAAHLMDSRRATNHPD